jgi:hypothetical protein
LRKIFHCNENGKKQLGVGNVREGLSIDVWPEGERYGRAARKRKSDPESE